MRTIHDDPKHRWRTPRDFLRAVEERYLQGNSFSLDCCCDDESDEWSCGVYGITKKDDALADSLWTRYCTKVNPSAWLNTPYGLGVIGPWLDRAVVEVERFNIMCILTECSPDVGWWRKLAEVSDEVLSVGRLRFIDIDGNEGDKPRTGHSLFVLRPERLRTGHATLKTWDWKRGVK